MHRQHIVRLSHGTSSKNYLSVELDQVIRFELLRNSSTLRSKLSPEFILHIEIRESPTIDTRVRLLLIEITKITV